MAIVPEPASEKDHFTFELAGQMPSGKNQVRTAMIRGRLMRFPNARFKAWRAAGFQRLQTQRKGWPILTGPASVQVAYYPGDRLRRDVPGIIDALCHLLEYCPVCKKRNKECNLPVVRDDSLLINWNWITMGLDRDNPRIYVTIIPHKDTE